LAFSDFRLLANRRFPPPRSPEPAVIYAAAVRAAGAGGAPPMPNVAQNGRPASSNFLFGDGPQQGNRYQQQPAYQAQPDYQQQPGYGYGRAARAAADWIRQQSMRQARQEQAVDPAQRPGRSENMPKQVVDYTGQGRWRAPSSSIRPNSSCSWCRATARALRLYGHRRRPSPASPGSGRSRRFSAKKEWPAWDPARRKMLARPSRSCRGTWKAVRKNPLGAPRDGIWDRRSTAHSRFQRTPGPSAHQRLVRLHPGCAMKT